MPRKARSFSSNVHYGPSCWEWMGATNDSGYGTTRIGGPSAPKTTYAHRLSYETHSGEKIPPGMVVMHKCDNPRCVRFDHLRLGTNQQNIQDRNGKGRTASGSSSGCGKKTHCPAGHEYSGYNLLVISGERKCRECRDEQWARWWRNKHQANGKAVQ